jgi:tRNA nucleotidyltransferase (CCA-adding enzyme)
MPDYIYLLEHRLSASQQSALRTIRDLARESQMTVFLAGDAVRDLTCGNPVRGLEVVVHGNPFDFKSAALAAGAQIWGEDEPSRVLYLCFPGMVRLDVSAARRTEYPKPGQPVHNWASIQEDLRGRDFTVNAMAVSLNEGSYGLLMDPTNGVADIEARLLRLVSNYGFLDNPARLIRATRYKAKLAFELEERTQTRYDNAKGDDVIVYLSDHERGAELEQIAHEDEPIKVMQALEAEGWMQQLFPAWSSSKADVEKLKGLHDLSIELQVQGVHPEISAAQMQLLTAKLAQKDQAQLKKMLLRPGFVEEWNRLDAHAAEFAKALLSKESATPSAGFTLFTTYAPEAVLWLGFTSKQASIREKYDNFLKVWPQARQRIPFALMQEMRITPEVPGYTDLVKSIFLQLIDGGLTNNDEIRALLEPHSPPAPPPPVTIKRTRAKKSADAKAKAAMSDDDEDSDDLGGDDDEDEDDIDGLDIDGEDLDFSIGSDDVRASTPVADGEDDDVFARDSVGDDDLDLDSSGDSDNDSDEGSDSDSGESGDDDPPPAKSGRGAKAGRSGSSAPKGGKAKSSGKGTKLSAVTSAKYSVKLAERITPSPASPTRAVGKVTPFTVPAKSAKPATPAAKTVGAATAATGKSKPVRSEESEQADGKSVKAKTHRTATRDR